MSLPTSIVFLVRKGPLIFLVKSKTDGKWTLPGGHPWKECRSIIEFAKETLEPYFRNLLVKSVKVVTAPEDTIVLKDERVRCSVVDCKILGETREEMQEKIWLTDRNSLVPQVISEDVRCLFSLPEVQSYLV